jgi:16S rRNA (cytosine967-C5)-methyltransferase
VPPLFPEVPDMARGEHGQLWPHRHGTDAMYVALLRTGDPRRGNEA